MKKIFLILTGFALIVIDVWLYFQAETNHGIYILIFGIFSAITFPLSIELIKYGFGDDEREAIKKLTKLPEIEELIEKAETQEQKIKILKNEYSKLQDIIQCESERLALYTKKEDLEKEAKRILEELEIVESEISSLDEIKVEGIHSEEVIKLHQRVQAKLNDNFVIKLGHHQFIIDSRKIMDIPFFGSFFSFYLKICKDLFIQLEGIFKLTKKR